MQVENRFVATYVGGIARVIHHQHTAVSRWRSLCELVKADGGRELELSAMTFVEHSLHEVIIKSACGKSPVTVNLYLLDIIDIIGLVHLEDALDDERSQLLAVAAKTFRHNEYRRHNVDVLWHCSSEIKRGVRHSSPTCISHHIKVADIHTRYAVVAEESRLRGVNVQRGAPAIDRPHP